jgi:hypothetical protein
METNKQNQAKKLIEKYFYQITIGCKNVDCKNEYCQSSTSSLIEKNLTPNQAAVKAIQLYVEEAKLCERLQENIDNKSPLSSPSTLAKSSSSLNFTPSEDIEMREASNEW